MPTTNQWELRSSSDSTGALLACRDDNNPRCGLLIATASTRGEIVRAGWDAVLDGVNGPGCFAIVSPSGERCPLPTPPGGVGLE